MNIALWAVQIILALVFLSAGFLKTFQTAKAKEKMDWAKDSSVGYIRLIGLAELAGGIGLILPWAFDILPVLTPIAAAGLGIIMLLAVILHAKRSEYKAIPSGLIFLLCAIFIALYRF